MFKNYLLLSLRNLLANKLFSTINIMGLAVGLARVILISLFVQHELSYDRHWENADRTYKVMRTFLANNGSPDLDLATNAPQVGPLLKQDFPEFEQVIRIMAAGQLLFTHPETNQPYYEQGIQFVDPEIYQVFDLPLLEGDWETALSGPFQMVISESIARKYFGDESPLNKTILLAGQAPVQVTGVMEELEANSHLTGEVYVSLNTTVAMFGESFLQGWSSNNFHTYVVIPENYDIETFKAEIPAFMNRHIRENATSFTRFDVMPLTEIHLNSNRANEFQANGNITSVYTFSAIAFFILLIACFNFMNLSTARSASRAREVGLRKTLGADKSQIVLQFLGESLFLTLVAMLLALAMVELLLPWFNSLIGLELSVDLVDSPLTLSLLLGLVILVGVLAGSYPAFYLASFSAANILRGEIGKGSGGVSLRKFLVVVQFAISIGLIVAAGIALSQLRYAMNLDPGYTREQILYSQGDTLEGLGSNYETMKQELLSHPEILSVTAANLLPGDQNTNSDGVRFEGGSESDIGLPYLNVDYDFFETFEIDVIAGRSFSRERATDIFVEPNEERPNTTASYILNESAARQIGYSANESLNKWFEVSRGGGDYRVRGLIVGVVDDIYFSSIREEVKPVYYRVMDPINSEQQFPNFDQMAVRVSGRNMDDTLESIASIWENFLPNAPLRQTFLEQKLEALYQSESRQGDIFTAFSIMAFFIAGLGLFGLASYLTEQRTREIGIRKVLGSSVLEIVTMLTRDFSKLVLIANIIAWPVAWYFMNAWLQNFAYRTSINFGIFLLAAFFAWLLASLTVGILAANAANMNPTQSLRHE